MGRRKGIPGLSFSWKRALGISAAKGKLARELGIPLTRQGRQRKVGKAMGCCAPFVAMVLVAAVAAAGLFSVGDALAHSGGLDSKGCHHDRKNGGYHCHRPQAQPQPPPQPQLQQRLEAAPYRTNLTDGQTSQQPRSFANCSDARAAGAAPVRRGEAGYSRKLDRDGDGVGCE
jgi:hypothetical protein